MINYGKIRDFHFFSIIWILKKVKFFFKKKNNCQGMLSELYFLFRRKWLNFYFFKLVNVQNKKKIDLVQNSII